MATCAGKLRNRGRPKQTDFVTEIVYAGEGNPTKKHSHYIFRKYNDYNFLFTA